MSRGGAVVRVVRTSGLGVLRQLKLEEALLRADASNWCIVNDGVDSPAAVLGLSGKPDIMLDLPLVKASGLAVVRRFSGGGTVVVDRDTLMVSFIFGAEAAPHVPCFPAPLMLWSEQFYSGVFHDTAGFRLRENDYVFGERKFGGNAQCITKMRWVHHTSFLWDYQPALMACLQHPPRAPEYRQGRLHDDFICKLRERWPRRTLLGERIAMRLRECGYRVLDSSLEEASQALSRPHLCGSAQLDDIFADRSGRAA